MIAWVQRLYYWWVIGDRHLARRQQELRQQLRREGYK